MNTGIRPTPELVARYDVATPRYTSYPPATEWTPDDVDAERYAAGLHEAARHPERPLSLYVHLPFCHQLCTFCGCNVIVSRGFDRCDAYLDDLEREIAMVAGHLGARRQVAQLHWGGGTPTFLDVPRIERLWSVLARHFTFVPDAEIAIEVHPGFTSIEQIRLLRRLGFNRLSMGVQDLDPRVRDAIGRRQTPDQIRELLEEARRLGFEGVNLDLIYGLPHQTPESWARTLSGIIDLRPDRLAVYSFAYVPRVRPQQRKLETGAMLQGAAKLDLFLQAREAFLAAGYVPVGMDHFALPGDPLARAGQEGVLGRNFQGYTVRAAPETVAFGVTGIGDVAGLYVQNVKSLREYHAALDAGRLPVERGLQLSADDTARRRLVTELMCNFRLRLDPAESVLYAPELAALAPLAADGLVTVDATPAGTDLKVTPLGRFFVRNVATVFDTWRRRPSETPVFSRAV